MIRTIALFLAAAGPGPAPAPHAPSFEEAVAVCRAIESGQGDKAKAALEAMPDDARAPVPMLCLGYHQGLADSHAAQRALTGGREI